MSLVSCYLCGSSSRSVRPGTVRDAPQLAIHECDNCGLVSVEQDTDHGEGFYAESGMHGDDPAGIETWLNETAADDERRVTELQAKITNARVLDVGCGAGGFLMGARPYAKSVTGIEPEARLDEHFRNVGIDCYESIHAEVG